jgi:tetratricopeptide (TPR) repeat protein
MISEIYREVVNNPKKFLGTEISKKTIYPEAFFALANSLDRKITESEQHLANIDFAQLNKSEQPIYLETQLINAYYKKNMEKTKDIALQAIEMNPDSYLAYLFLGKVSENNNDLPNAIKYYEKFLTEFPDYELALYGLIRVTVLQTRKTDEAKKIISRCKPSCLKTIYQLFLPFAAPTVFRLFSIFLLFIPFLLFPVFPGFVLGGLLLIGFIGEVITFKFFHSDKFILARCLEFQSGSVIIYIGYISLRFVFGPH